MSYPPVNDSSFDDMRDDIAAYVNTHILETYAHQQDDEYTRRAIIRDIRQYLNFVQANVSHLAKSSFHIHSLSHVVITLTFLVFEGTVVCKLDDSPVQDYSADAFDRAMKGI